MSDIALTDWLTFVPAGEIRRQRAYVDLPAFSYAAQGSVGQASVIVAQFNFSASRNFYLLTRPTKPTGVNYGLCIRYRVGETVYRYKLWEDAAFILSSETPVYAKQLIKKNFVLEVWSFPGTVSTQTTSIRMLSSVRSVPTDYRAIADYALAVGAEFTDFGQTNVAPTSRSATSLVADYSASVSHCEIDFSNNVQTMYDQSGNGRNATQGTAGFRPAHSLFLPPLTPPVSFDTVLFDAVDDILPWTGAGVSFAAGSSVYLVGRLESVVATTRNLLSLGPDAVGIASVSNLSFIRGTYKAHLTTPIPVVITDFTLIEAFSNSANTYLFNNNTLPGVNNGVLTGVDEIHSQGALGNETTISLGGFGGSFGRLRLARLLVYNVQHTLEQRTLIRQYLENFYGIATITLPLTFNSGGAWLDNV